MNIDLNAINGRVSYATKQFPNYKHNINLRFAVECSLFVASDIS